MSEQNPTVPSIVKALFFGEVNEETVFPFPKLSEDQKSMAKEMVNAVNKFADDNIDSAKFDEEAQVPEEVWQGLAQLGMCGLGVEEQFGGMELDITLYARVFSEMSGIDASIATMLGAHQSIGYKALVNEGNADQKAKWLPLLASGEKVAAFCLTEPGSGSDAYSIKTKAVKNSDGTYTINGQKLWITNGGRAEFYTVFCKTEHEINGETKEKITCFIVEKDFEGVSFGEKENKMGIRASETRAVYFDNVVVPESNIIGEPGKGFKIAMNVLNTGRLSLGSGSVGAMKTALKLATNQAMNRKQFGDTINNYGLIQEKLARMAANIYACESMVYLATGRMNEGMTDYSMESAVCKVYCSEKLWETVDMATQIAAGNGFMREYPYERLMRDARINLIFEGTNEILRIFLALSGIKEPGETLKELGKVADITSAIKDPIKSVGVLTSFAAKRLGRMVGSKTLSQVHPSLEEHGLKFSSMLTDFAVNVERVLMKYGKNIIGNELPQMRLANMVIQLYAMLATLSRTTTILKDDGVSDNDKQYALSMAELICRDSRQQFIRNQKRLDGNYDKTIPQVSKAVCDREGYGLDIVDF
jgi:acyl-CoA dehydrogenase family protein 9